jgi:hypothetical protein
VREILTVARRTCRFPRCTEAPYPRLLVQPAERGKPDALSASDPDRVAQAQVRGMAQQVKDREEAKAGL